MKFISPLSFFTVAVMLCVPHSFKGMRRANPGFYELSKTRIDIVFADRIENDVTQFVRDAANQASFSAQRRYISEAVAKYGPNWPVIVPYQPVLATHNGGGAVIAQCHIKLQGALGEAHLHARLAEAAQECMTLAMELLSKNGASVPVRETQTTSKHIRDYVKQPFITLAAQ